MSPPEADAARLLNVLIVEDSAADAERMIAELRKAGYSPVARRAGTRTEVGEALEGGAWDLVLCAYHLDDFTYQDVLSLVREKGISAPVLLVSGTVVDEAAVSAVRAGARDIVMKDRLSRLAHAVERELAAARDRVRQRSLEEGIQRSEARFRAMIENSFDAICLLDAEGVLQYASPAATRILGYATPELAGRSAFELLLPEDRPLARQRLGELIALPGQTLTVQLRAIRKDGDVIWTEYFGTNRLEDPSIGAVVVNFRDITGQKRFEQILRENEENAQRELAELEHIYHTAPVGLCLIGVDLRYLRINERLAAMNGLPAQEHLGRTVWEVIPEAAPFVAPLLQRIIDSGRPVLDWQVRTEGPEAGHPRDLLASYYPVKDASGKVLGVAGVVQEITELKRVERALRESEQRFRALIENSADGVALLDVHGNVKYSGPAILGYESHQSMRGDGFALVHPEDRARATAGFAEFAAHPGAVSTSELRVRHRDGSWRWIEAVSKNLLADRVIAGIVVNYRDVTERKRLEEQMRQTQKLESIGVLAGGVAHDFNNLLTGVLGNATLALDGLAADHPARPYLEEVIRAADSAAHLTRQLLAYSGKGRFVVQAVDLSDLTREMTALVRTSIPRSIELRLDLAPDLPATEGDRGQLQQLIMNLVINGAEAIAEGGNGTVTVSTGQVTIDETYGGETAMGTELQPGRYVLLEVRDSGCGMDAETQSKIFDPFFTTKFSGRGLGLSAALGIVRGHKGAIRVSSAPGRGTTFQVLLPASTRLATRLPSPAANKDLRGSGTILVADDEPIVRRAAKAALEKQGYFVLLASDGRAAVDLLRTHRGGIRLVLLDLTMPVLGGEEALRALRAVQPDVKIVLSSGFNEAEAIQRFADERFSGFLQKPYSAAQLAEKVKAVLEAG
ncbi:MAG TPA: PAS domain S-box protein [Bryobacteraceae bacterium]|nr:PAS domain S-box protein [Bryobacteraceae bacterium]